MAKYAVTPEGVAALKKCSSSLTQSLETVKAAITDISTLAADNKEGLGPHADEVESIISDLQVFTKDAQTPVDTLSKKLDGLAAKYDGIIAKKLGGSGKK